MPLAAYPDPQQDTKYTYQNWFSCLLLALLDPAGFLRPITGGR